MFHVSVNIAILSIEVENMHINKLGNKKLAEVFGPPLESAVVALYFFYQHNTMSS